jgi:hypothetical protein
LFQNPYKWVLQILAALVVVGGLSACNSEQSKQESPEKTSTNEEKQVVLKNNITLSSIRGTIRNKVDFTIDELEPNAPVELIWMTADGKYIVEDLYAVIGPEFKEKEVLLTKGTSDVFGEWKGSFTVPEGFGGDQTIYVTAGKTKIGQTGFTVDPTFVMSPESGPVGTEITIKVEGLGSSTYMRNWQLTYDNKYTGLITAISTNGSAEAKFRAAGPIGDHAIRIRTGYLGMQYINYLQSPYPDKPAPDFMFKVTDEKVVLADFVEPTPVAANGGVDMPKLKNKSNVKVKLDKIEGTVGEQIKMMVTGLPKDKKVGILWNTMKGSRVSGLGFAEQSTPLATMKTDAQGKLAYDFTVPDDLGGIPHRIDLVVDNVVFGQEYLRILPSIVSVSPKSGPVGTKIEVTIKGGGWTEFDNAYYLTYDNSYTGYLCAFNSQGNLTFDVIATGEQGYHIIDLYPGIYKQKKLDTDMTLIPQLTYSTDHPGSAMPAIRLGFEITE